MRGDAIGGRVLGEEQGRRARVQRRPSRRGQLGQQRLVDDRVHEVQLALDRQDVGGPQPVGRDLGGLAVQVRQRGGVAQRGAGTEDGQRLGEVVAVQAEATDPHEHAAPDGARAERAHAPRHLDGGPPALAAQVGEQLAQVERVAAGRLVAGPAQLVVGARAQLAAHELAARGLAQWRGLEDEAGALAQRGERAGDLPPPLRDDQHGGQRVDAAGQIEQEPGRRLVKPVRVIHEQRHRALVTAVRDQPVEAVQHRDGAVGLRRDVGLSHEHRGGEPRRAAEGVRSDRGRQQLAHDGERRLHRHVVAAGLQTLHAQFRGMPGTGAQQRALADAGRPLDHHEGAAAIACGRQQAVEAR